jgi:cell division protein FtsQ
MVPPIMPGSAAMPGAAPRRAYKRIVWAPLATLVVLVILLLEGPALLRASGIAHLLPRWPIESVSITGEIYQISHAKLSGAINNVLDTDFFGLDVGSVRDVALNVPWVEEVSVRKVWPDRLVVQVRERQAAARWQTGGLVGVDGERFDPGPGKHLETLPLLYGPKGTANAVLARYRALSLELAPIGERITGLTLDPRSGWRVVLESQLELALGHDVSDESLGELAARLPSLLGTRFADAARIDLRYTNGFAVRWRTATATTETQQ